MPIIKSAKKRVRTAEKAAVRNSKTKRTLKGAVKAFGKALTGSDKKAVKETQSKAQSALGKAAKKNVMHKNKVARKQSQLAKAAKAHAGTEAKTSAKTVKKAAAPKKAVAKKPAAKKPAAKKTTKK
ncbi:MAG TPA: 30S ribosomal protein S20 [Candidatus Saccharimonadales bacterium]